MWTNGTGGRFPEPVPDLVVEGLHLTRLDDVGVIAEAVEQLRSVGLRVDRVQFVALDEDVVLVAVDDGPGDIRARTDRMNVCSRGARPDPGQRSERPEVRERVVVAVRLAVDVGSVVVNTSFAAHERRITAASHRALVLFDCSIGVHGPGKRIELGRRPDRDQHLTGLDRRIR